MSSLRLGSLASTRERGVRASQPDNKTVRAGGALSGPHQLWGQIQELPRTNAVTLAKSLNLSKPVSFVKKIRETIVPTSRDRAKDEKTHGEIITYDKRESGRDTSLLDGPLTLLPG